MAKNPIIKTPKRKKKDETAAVIAEKAGLSDRHVRRVINGECENEKVLTAAITYIEGKNQLLQEVERLLAS
jgi:hypothetical protein